MSQALTVDLETYLCKYPDSTKIEFAKGQSVPECTVRSLWHSVAHGGGRWPSHYMTKEL